MGSLVDGVWVDGELPRNVVFGARCTYERTGTFAAVRGRRDPAVVLGNDVVLRTWTTFSVEGEGLIEVGDECLLIGAYIFAVERVTLGKRVRVSYYATIIDSDFHPKDPDARRLDAVANAPGGDAAARPAYASRPVIIDDDVWIGTGSTVLKGVHIGAGARIGPGAVVTRDVPAGAYIVGNPGRITDIDPFA